MKKLGRFGKNKLSWARAALTGPNLTVSMDTVPKLDRSKSIDCSPGHWCIMNLGCPSVAEERAEGSVARMRSCQCPERIARSTAKEGGPASKQSVKRNRGF